LLTINAEGLWELLQPLKPSLEGKSNCSFARPAPSTETLSPETADGAGRAFLQFFPSILRPLFGAQFR
jgi:hypothetical protein